MNNEFREDSRVGNETILGEKMELKEILGSNYDEEKELMEKDEKTQVCEACGLAHITSSLMCPICFYEWADGDDAEEIRQRYFDYIAEKDAKLFFRLKEKYQNEFGEKWKVKLQEDNFLWIVDKMEEVYKNL